MTTSEVLLLSLDLGISTVKAGLFTPSRELVRLESGELLRHPILTRLS